MSLRIGKIPGARLANEPDKVVPNVACSILASPAVSTGRRRSAAQSRAAQQPGKGSELAARCMMQAYDWQGAMETCRRMLRHDPDHLGALEILAQAQWFGGQFDRVIATTSRLLRLNPLEPGYRYTRGMAHLSKGDLVPALEDFETALEQSNDPVFREQVSNSLRALESWMGHGAGRSNRMSAFSPRACGRLN